MKLATILLSFALLAGPAAAQKMGEVDVDRGPTSELYIRKRPAIPEAPVLTQELNKLLNATEIKRDQKRLDAIAMLRAFLASDPLGDTKADGTFKLAELLWEESRRQYLVRMDSYSRELEACSRKKNGCEPPPPEPRINLKESEKLYADLLVQKPDFRRADLVTYLIGFAAKEDQREEEALGKFREVIEKYPDSPLYGDAWMMVGEHHFQQNKWEEALAAYSNIGPNAPTYDVALFKTAWCQWKLGDVNAAALSFKKVLDLNEEKSGSIAQQRRRASLRDEALDYLVIVFTEDRSISAQEVFDFLASIGGEKYSKDVLIKVAESYVGQSEFELANNTFKFLIKMDANALKSAEWQRSIIENWNSALEPRRAQEEIRILLTEFGPGTKWAKEQRNKEALNRSIELTEKLVRVTARNLQADAQSREKGNKCKVVPQWMDADKAAKEFQSGYLKGGLKRCGPDVLPLFKEAAVAYGQYLDAFAASGVKEAVEVRFLRGQILYFKIGELEAAGDEFMAVAKTAPVTKEYHRDALKAAMDAFERARPQKTACKSNQLDPVDTKFGEALDLYATLFPGDDKELTNIIYRNGKMFYDCGAYDEAIKRFGVIVTRYPKDPNAGPAGDRILDALVKGNDYENVEDWARKLKKADAFKSKDQQDRLDRLIVESIGKSGDKYADAGKFEKAAGFYLRVPKEFPNHPMAAEKMMNAGVMYERAKLPERAADVYLELATDPHYANKPGADKAAFAAAVVYDKVVFYDRAADAYELVVKNFKNSDKRADALYNAGRLRQALGQSDKAIAHYKAYAQTYSSRPDAPAVAFNVGVVYEESGEDGKAEQAFRQYAKTYSSGKRVIEAHLRAGRAALKLGQIRRAADELELTLKLYSKERGKEKIEAKSFAAEARYYQGDLVFRQFEAVRIDVKPRALTKALKHKLELLGKAQKVYESVIEFDEPKWATAALYRTAQIFDVFAEALINTPTPAGLTPAEAQAYRDAMDLVVVDTQEKAVALFSAGYEKAIKIQVYDSYTAKIREALGRLAADKYPPEREARSHERFGDRPLGMDLVTEVAR